MRLANVLNMNPYIDRKEVREFEDANGYKTIIEKNIIIGKFLGFQPEIEWMVGDDEGSCFHPKSLGYSDPASQKAYAEKWLKEQQDRFPDGWVVREGNKVICREYFPDFHSDWNHLIEAVKRLRKLNKNIEVDYNSIFQSWFAVVQNVC